MRLLDLISPEDLREALHSFLSQECANQRCDDNVKLIDVALGVIGNNRQIPAREKTHAKITAVFIIAAIDEAIENATKGVRQ